MGQKVNPVIFRVGPLNTWNSRWFARRDYAALVRQDELIKKYLRTKYREAGIAKVEIERSGNTVTLIVHTGKPGVLIGRGGAGIEELKRYLLQTHFAGSKKTTLNLNIQEVANPNLSAELMVQSMATDLEKRLPFRRVMKQAISRVQKAGAQGVKVMCKGRLNGAEIARTEQLAWGKLPLHTLRADIDYSRGAAHTTYGKVGVKVWIFKGMRFTDEPVVEAAAARPARRAVRSRVPR